MIVIEAMRNIYNRNIKILEIFQLDKYLIVKRLRLQFFLPKLSNYLINYLINYQ